MLMQGFGRMGGEGIEGPVLMALGPDETFGFQVFQMSGGVDLGDVEQMLDVTDAERAVHQQIQNPQPRGIAKTFIEADQIFHEGLYTL